MNTERVEKSENEIAFEKWKKVSGEMEGYAAFIDGDWVEGGIDFQAVAINASELKRQRGKEAQMEIFEIATGIPTPGL